MLCRGCTRCIRLSRNDINEKEELKFNAQGRVCSKLASMFATWCGYCKKMDKCRIDVERLNGYTKRTNRLRLENVNACFYKSS